MLCKTRKQLDSVITRYSSIFFLKIDVFLTAIFNTNCAIVCLVRCDVFVCCCFKLVTQLLDSLPTMFNNSHNVYSATGAALQAALKLIVSRYHYLCHY